MSDFPEPATNNEVAVQVSKPKLKKPPLYRVMLLNDDYTTQDFVVIVLQAIFHHSQQKATQIMLHVHQRGFGVCGIFTREVAESKVEQVLKFAQQNEHPLQCVMEPDIEDE